MTVLVGDAEMQRLDIQIPAKYGACYRNPDMVGPGSAFRVFGHIAVDFIKRRRNNEFEGRSES